MAELLCVLCISNRHPDDVRPARTVVGGLAVCYDEEDSEHYDLAWGLLDKAVRDAIVRADTTPPEVIEATPSDFEFPTLEELRPTWWRSPE